MNDRPIPTVGEGRVPNFCCGIGQPHKNGQWDRITRDDSQVASAENMALEHKWRSRSHGTAVSACVGNALV